MTVKVKVSWYVIEFECPHCLELGSVDVDEFNKNIELVDGQSVYKFYCEKCMSTCFVSKPDKFFRFVRDIYKLFVAWVSHIADGTSTDAFREYGHAARLARTKFDDYKRIREKFTETFGEVKLGAGSLTTYLIKYDEQLLSNIKNSKTTDEALNLILKALEKTSSAAERVALASAAFGKAGIDMIMLLE
jgi:hypothetical protein